MKIIIGDRVVVNTPEVKGEHGTVVEILSGQTSSTEVFEVVLDNGTSIWARTGQIEPEPEEEEQKEYNLKLDFADNVIIAILFKNGREIARGHGHIIHSGDIGVSQAISFATKRIWRELGGDENGQ